MDPMLAEQVMKRTPKCLTEKDTAQKAAKLMRDENVGFVPICGEGGKVIGIVTDRDIVVRLAAENGSLTTPLGSLMSCDPIVCKPEDDLSGVEKVMEEKRKSRIVCVDADGCPVGVISLSDIAQYEEGARAATLLRNITVREARPA
jgi:CBS domain-containing protein